MNLLDFQKVIQQETDYIVETEKELGLEVDKFPNRVAHLDKENVLVFGPQRSGRTRLALAIHSQSNRGFLCIDDAVEWALSGAAPKLFDNDFLDRIRSQITEKEALWESDAAAKTAAEQMIQYPDLIEQSVPRLSATGPPSDPPAPQPCYDLEAEDVLKIVEKRLSLCDFNTGFVCCGFAGCLKYLPVKKVLDVLFGLKQRLAIFFTEPAPKPEKMTDFFADIDYEALAAEEAAAAAAESGTPADGI